MVVYIIEIREDYETTIGDVYLSREKAEAAAETIQRGWRDAWVHERTIEDLETKVKKPEVDDERQDH